MNKTPQQINRYEKCIYDEAYLLLKAPNNMILGHNTIHNHKFQIIKDDGEFIHVTQSPIIRIPKKDLIFDKEEAIYQTIIHRIKEGSPMSSKHIHEYNHLIERAKKEHPQFLI